MSAQTLRDVRSNAPRCPLQRSEMSALSPLVSVSGVEGSEATRDTRHPTLSETVPAQTGLKNGLWWKNDDCRQLWDGNFDAGVCMISRIPFLTPACAWIPARGTAPPPRQGRRRFRCFGEECETRWCVPSGGRVLVFWGKAKRHIQSSRCYRTESFGLRCFTKSQ